MRCDHVQAVLDGEAPWVAVDAHLTDCADCSAHAAELAEVDAWAAELGEFELPSGLIEETLEELELERAIEALSEVAPPAGLIEETLAFMEQELAAAALPAIEPPAESVDRTARAMAAEVSGRPGKVVRGPWGRRIGTSAVAMLAAAVALMVVLPDEPRPADPDRLVERGSGERLPDVALKVAVEEDGQMARHSRAKEYGPGDTLYFRAQVDQPAWVGLLRVDADGAQLVHTETIEPGEQDLQLGAAPLAWRIEPGETDAVFALVAAPAGQQPEDLVIGLSSVNAEADDVCRAVEGLGARCSAVPVGVTP